MQTIYYKTKNFIRHEGNVVNLQEYRTRLQACSGFDAVPLCEEESAAKSPVLLFENHDSKPVEPPVKGQSKGKAEKERLSLRCLPDLCATVAIIVMAMTVIIRFLQF